MAAMKTDQIPKRQDVRPVITARDIKFDPAQDVIGWLLFIRHYGGNLRKYGGPSGTRKAAQA
jgi:hypothetical protein